MKHFSKPPVGAFISVTTRYRDYYYYAESEYRESTYMGRVLPDERWFKPGDFMMTSDAPHQVSRVVNLRNVIDLKINGEDADLNEVDNGKKVVEVRGSRGAQYWVTIEDGTAISCTCPGFTYRQRCRHLNEVVGEVDSKPKVKDTTHSPALKNRRATVTVHKRGNTDMSKSKTMSWNDRFALIDHYKPNDDAACSAFGVTQDELKTAREMRSAGAFTATPDIDVKSYANLFSAAAPAAASSTTKTSRRGGATRTKKTTTTKGKPATATKKTKEPKKRGRKGDKIATAFAAIPTDPTPVEDFASDHGVSIAVLRQSKRFDKSPELGAVRVKKDKETKTLMIWREAPSA